MGYERVGPQRQKPKPLQPLNSTDSFTQSAYRPPRLQARTFGWSPSVTERQRRVSDTAGIAVLPARCHRLTARSPHTGHGDRSAPAQPDTHPSPAGLPASLSACPVFLHTDQSFCICVKTKHHTRLQHDTSTTTSFLSIPHKPFTL